MTTSKYKYRSADYIADGNILRVTLTDTTGPQYPANTLNLLYTHLGARAAPHLTATITAEFHSTTNPTVEMLPAEVGFAQTVLNNLQDDEFKYDQDGNMTTMYWQYHRARQHTILEHLIHFIDPVEGSGLNLQAVVIPPAESRDSLTKYVQLGYKLQPPAQKPYNAPVPVYFPSDRRTIIDTLIAPYPDNYMVACQMVREAKAPPEYGTPNRPIPLASYIEMTDALIKGLYP